MRQIKPEHLPVVYPHKKPQRSADRRAHRHGHVFSLRPASSIEIQRFTSQRRSYAGLGIGQLTVGGIGCQLPLLK